MTDRQPNPEAGFEKVDKLIQAIEATHESGLTEVEQSTFIELIGQDTADDVFGTCDYPRICKFYGEAPSFCDRSCDESVWDQI